MMNMFQLQERIKDFSKDQLVREMQQPSGAVPPFLILSELQRRTRMEKAFQADQAQGQQSTVAQDAIAAAGVPQGGIADMARAMAPQTDMTENTGAMPVQNMAEGGEVRRMQPGGLTGNAELDEAMRRLQESVDRYEETMRGITERGDEQGLSEISADVGAFRPSPLRASTPAAEAGPLSRIDATVAASRTAPGLPSIRPTDAQPILNELAPPAFRDIAAPAAAPGPVQGPGRQSIEDAARMREINVTPGASGFPSQRDLDMRFLESQRELAAETAASAGQTPDPTSIILSDGVMGPIDTRPTPIADAFRAELAGRDARAAEAARMMEINELPELSTPVVEAPTDFSEFGGLPDFMTDPGAYRGEPYTRFADLFGFGPAIDLIPTTDADEIAPLTPDADTPRPVPRPDRETTPPAGGGEIGGTGGTGGAGGAGARATGTADADKWLALAQFGLGLMASQQPTLGGAIGEAGTMALGQLRESQKEAYERDLAERTLAARSAARPDRLSLSDRLDYITDQMDTVRTMLALEPDAGRKLDLANELTSLQEQAAAILGTAGPATARAAEGATDVRG